MNNNIKINGKILPRQDEILSEGALKFIQEIHEKFNDKRLELLEERKKRQLAIDAGEKLDISFSNHFVTNFVKEHIVFNKTIAKLPRWLVYPVVRYALYFEFLIQKYFFKDNHMLHRTTNAKVNSSIRITEEEIDSAKTNQKDRSLRSIVARRVKPNLSEREKALSALTGGP